MDAAELKALATSGRLKPDDKVRRDDMNKWHLARQVKGLFAPSQPQNSVPTLPSPVQQAPPATLESASREGAIIGTIDTSTAGDPTKGAAKPAAKQAALKALQLTDLEKADLAIGKKAFANSIGRQQFSNIVKASR